MRTLEKTREREQATQEPEQVTWEHERLTQEHERAIREHCHELLHAVAFCACACVKFKSSGTVSQYHDVGNMLHSIF